MIQLLSFDVGTKNLAYCIANIQDDRKFKVISLQKVDLNYSGKNIQKLIDNTIELLDIIINDPIIDTRQKLIVLIECQMTSIMRTIQTCINTYFKVVGKYQNLDIKTIYVSPKHKLKFMDKYPDIVVSDKHKQNKIDAIFYTTHLLTNIDEYKDIDTMNIINTNKKKDDLCDAYLMCVYYYITNEK
jgi:hypothetical protein